MERYLTAADAGRVLSLTPSGVRLLQRSGHLPLAAQTEGGIRLFRREDVERVARQRAKRAKPTRASRS